MNVLTIFLIADTNNLLENVKELSKIVLKNFKPMIPHNIQDVWEQGISRDSYFLKLCGIWQWRIYLGFTSNFEKAKQELSHYNLTSCLLYVIFIFSAYKQN